MKVKFRWMQFTTMDYKQFQLDFFFLGSYAGLDGFFFCHRLNVSTSNIGLRQINKYDINNIQTFWMF